MVTQCKRLESTVCHQANRDHQCCPMIRIEPETCNLRDLEAWVASHDFPDLKPPALRVDVNRHRPRNRHVSNGRMALRSHSSAQPANKQAQRNNDAASNGKPRTHAAMEKMSCCVDTFRHSHPGACREPQQRAGALDRHHGEPPLHLSARGAPLRVRGVDLEFGGAHGLSFSGPCCDGRFCKLIHRRSRGVQECLCPAANVEAWKRACC